jgi:predicted metal-dependent peptidase
MNLNIVENSDIENFNTDGTDLEINPEHFAKLPRLEREGCMAVKVFQCGMGHPYRQGGRDAEKWNEASRQVAHAHISKAGLTLPASCKVDPKYLEMSVEQAYSYNEAQARKQQQQNQGGQQGQQPQQGGQPQQGQNGQQGNQPGKPGSQQSGQGQGNPTQGKGASAPATGTISKPKPATPKKDNKGQKEEGQAPAKRMSETDWADAREQATNMSKKAGFGSASIEMAVKNERVATNNWKEETREFVVQTVVSDVSWAKQSRRGRAQGLILPGPVKENIGPIVVVFDTSGSVYSDVRTVEDFSAVVTTIAREVRPEKLIVIYCDTKVTAVDEYDTYDMEDIKVRPLGNGGTAFQPAFDYIEQMDAQPNVILYLTDLIGAAPIEPEVPVLWVTPAWVKTQAWFGRTINIDRHAS